MNIANVIETLIAIYIAVGVLYLVIQSFQGEKPNAIHSIFGWPVDLYNRYK